MIPELIPISVRELIEFAMRSGNLDSAFVNTARAVEGTRGHQYVQSLRPAEYQSEVAVSFVYQSDPVSLEISGRIDGILHDTNSLMVEEIKTTYSRLDQHSHENPRHWAQAKIYGYILAVQFELTQIDVQLTYLQLETKELFEKRCTFSLEELALFSEEIITRYIRWEYKYREYCWNRDQSISQLNFPFPKFRLGQEELSDSVADTITAERRLYAEAPTGIGKTISVLFPSVKTISSGQIDKIFYLTAKTSGRGIAEKAFTDLRGAGLKFKSVTLTARDRICFNSRDGHPCDTETCEFAIGFHDRINKAVEEAFGTDAATRTVIEKIARKHTVCPFELSLELSVWADAIICDYNYAFDPKSYLRRHFLDQKNNYVFLVDEAHNLVERARDMYSAEITKNDILALKKELGKNHPHLAKALTAINAYLLDVCKRCENEGDGKSWLANEKPDDLLYLLERFQSIAEAILSKNSVGSYRTKLLELFFVTVGFLRVADLYDERYVTYAEKTGRNLRMRLYCLDPSVQIRNSLTRAKSAIFFSATMAPIEYFRDLLGGDRDDFTVSIASPFPTENLALLVADHIDTSYKGRRYSYDEVAHSIAVTIQEKRGNYIAYFPSYQYLEEVSERFRAIAKNTRVMIQRRQMSEIEREEFLSVFADDNVDTVVGFAVMGGIFGEGIDLVGERLVGAIVVGVGLPQICLERDLIRRYFDDQNESGFAYAYTFPGMNRVLQASGRVIRSEQDRGLIMLIDRRFGQEQYRELFPAHWTNPKFTRGSDQISQQTSMFWGE